MSSADSSDESVPTPCRKSARTKIAQLPPPPATKKARKRANATLVTSCSQFASSATQTEPLMVWISTFILWCTSLRLFLYRPLFVSTPWVAFLVGANDATTAAATVATTAQKRFSNLSRLGL